MPNLRKGGSEGTYGDDLVMLLPRPLLALALLALALAPHPRLRVRGSQQRLGAGRWRRRQRPRGVAARVALSDPCTKIKAGRNGTLVSTMDYTAVGASNFLSRGADTRRQDR